MTNLVFLSGLSLYGIFVLLRFGFFELLKITFVIGELLALEMDYFFTSRVQEISCMGNNQNSCLSQLLDVLFKPNECGKIQMVRGLIKKEYFWLREDNLSDSDSHTPTSREGIRSSLEILKRKTNTHKDLSCFGFTFGCSNYV